MSLAQSINVAQFLNIILLSLSSNRFAASSALGLSIDLSII